jgi:hypothetical protein
MAAIDLRPMSLGEVLDRTFSLYKSRFWLFAGIAALPYLIISIFSVAVRPALGNIAPAPGASVPPAQLTAALSSALEGLLVYMGVFLCAYAAAQAATVAAVSDLYLGRPASIRQSFARVRGKIVPVIIVILLTGILVGAGIIFFVIPGIIVLCRTAVAVPAATLEDVSVVEAISRSWRLTKGSAAGIFLVFILFFMLGAVAALIFQGPFLLAAGSIFRPHALSPALTVLSSLAAWVSNVIVAPIATIAFSLIYYNQRIQKEAFDLQQLMAALGSGAAQTPVSGSASPA